MARNGSFRRRLGRWATRLRRPSMGLVLGADSCRYVVSGRVGQVASEPAMLWRKHGTRQILLNGRSIGEGARNTLICSSSAIYERVRPFDADLAIDAHTLRSMLRYFRDRAAERFCRRRPNRLVVTGRPGLVEAVRLMLADAARRARFRDAEVVPEQACLAWTIRADCPGPVLFVDVGYSGTRVYGWREGRFAQVPFVRQDVGGQQILAVTVDRVAQVLNLAIGYRTAEQLAAALTDPGGWPRTIKGRCRAAGLPRAGELTHDAVAAAMRPVLERIVELCRAAAAAMGVATMADGRVVLAGAGAATYGLADLLRDRLGAVVEQRPAPGDVSARGLARLLSSSRTDGV